MSTRKKILLGCGGLVVLAAVVAVSLVGLILAKKRQYDRIAFPFFEEVIPVLSTWDSKQFRAYWAPEVIEQIDTKMMRRLFALYRQLGGLVSYEEPEFQNIVVSTEIPYPAVVLYLVSAEYEAGEAMLTFQLVRTDEGKLKVWSLGINSDAFLPLGDEVESGEPEVMQSPSREATGEKSTL